MLRLSPPKMIVKLIIHFWWKFVFLNVGISPMFLIFFTALAEAAELCRPSRHPSQGTCSADLRRRGQHRNRAPHQSSAPANSRLFPCLRR